MARGATGKQNCGAGSTLSPSLRAREDLGPREDSQAGRESESSLPQPFCPRPAFTGLDEPHTPWGGRG